MQMQGSASRLPAASEPGRIHISRLTDGRLLAALSAHHPPPQTVGVTISGSELGWDGSSDDDSSCRHRHHTIMGGDLACMSPRGDDPIELALTGNDDDDDGFGDDEDRAHFMSKQQ